MNENNAYLAVPETRRPFQISLLSAFNEIAQTFLRTPHGKVHTSLQSYLDGGVAIDGAYFTRRAILLAIHDMKDNLKAPLALQETALAELLSLKVRPTPELKLYRDIATALLRMEVVLRSTAPQATEVVRRGISDDASYMIAPPAGLTGKASLARCPAFGATTESLLPRGI